MTFPNNNPRHINNDPEVVTATPAESARRFLKAYRRATGQDDVVLFDGDGVVCGCGCCIGMLPAGAHHLEAGRKVRITVEVKP